MISFPPSAITELSGPPGCGKAELALQFLASSPARTAWVEEVSHATVYPRAFPERGVPLSQVLFVQTHAKETATVLQQLLASQAFHAIVVSASLALSINVVDLRRMQINAERARTRVILLSTVPTPEGARWMIARQLRVRRQADGIFTEVLKDGKKPLAYL